MGHTAKLYNGPGGVKVTIPESDREPECYACTPGYTLCAMHAAAPELLAACKAMLPLTHFDTCAGLNFRHGSVEREDNCTCGASMARAAIARAEGRP